MFRNRGDRSRWGMEVVDSFLWFLGGAGGLVSVRGLSVGKRDR